MGLTKTKRSISLVKKILKTTYLGYLGWRRKRWRVIVGVCS